MEAKKKPAEVEETESVSLVRIMGSDIPGDKSLFIGLTKIKGISWAQSKAICYLLKLNPTSKIGELGKEEIGKIESRITKIETPLFLRNRRRDPETGEDRHLFANDLDIRKEFDIKRMKKIKSYKGLRHMLGQPVRGQRTRSHFRKKGKATGVSKKKDDKKA